MGKPETFDLPEAEEKLSSKFILDSLRGLQMRRLIAEIPDAAEERDILPDETSIPAMELEKCGTAAPKIVDPPPILEEQEPEPRALKLEPGKKYFRIGEVAEIIGVEPYVLRYWESEFASIKPTKSKSGQRVYSRKDVETLDEIRHLLHIEKFSVKGAKKRLLEQKKSMKQTQSAVNAVDKTLLKELASELKSFIHFVREQG